MKNTHVLLRAIAFLVAAASVAPGQFTFTRVANTNSVMPTPWPWTTNYFSSFGRPAILGGGVWGFTVAFCDGADYSACSGVYWYDFHGGAAAPGNPIHAVIHVYDEEFPDLQFSDIADSATSVLPRLGGGSTTAGPIYTFAGELATGEEVIFSAERTPVATNFTRIVGVGDTVPVPGGTATLTAITGFAPDPDTGTYYYIGLGSNRAGLYQQGLMSLRLIADRSTPLPGTGTNLLHFQSLSAQMDRLAFVAVPSPPFTYLAGIYSVVTGKVFKVVNTDTPMPPFTYACDGYGNAIVRSNKVVFQATRFWWPQQNGIFMANLDGSSLQPLVTSLMTLPGTTNSYWPRDFDYEDGVLVFAAVLDYAVGGATAALFVQAGGVITRIVGPGDSLDFKTVSNVQIGSRALNGGWVAFWAGFTDGSSGIYVTAVSSGGPGPYLAPGSPVYSRTAGLSFSFVGRAGVHYRIQYATSLPSSSWTNLTDFTFTVPLVIHDSSAASSIRRYYRAISP
jgi:hypothetical protein